ncbi:hypothetical protein ACWGKS_27310 [Nocardiopsis sp. NPDC055879]
MSDRPTLSDIEDEDVRTDIEGDIDLLVRRIAHALDDDVAFPTAEEALNAHPHAARADLIMMLTGAEALRIALAANMAQRARHLGANPAVTYTDLGAAVGISRQAARERWPGAIRNARPGRPKKTVTVELSGGHPAWDGETLEIDCESVYDLDLDDVGALLMIEDGSYPDHLSMQEGVDWRAHYAPESEDTRTAWTFQGWVPA